MLKIVLFILVALNLGVPSDSWSTYVICSIIIGLFFSSHLKNKNNIWMYASIVTLFTVCVRVFMVPPSIDEGANVFIGGEKYKHSIFAQKMPEEVFKYLNEKYTEDVKINIMAPDKLLYDVGVSQIWWPSNYTNSKYNVNWEGRYALRLGAFNDRRYNSWGEQQPARDKLPYFVHYLVPDILAKDPNTKLCWEGSVFLPVTNSDKINGNFFLNKHFEEDCVFLKSLKYNTKQLEFWGVETGSNDSLSIKIELPIKWRVVNFIRDFVPIVSVVIILCLVFASVNLKHFFYVFLSFFLSTILMIFYAPSIVDGFLLFEGGNDGLSYAHFAHIISDRLAERNFLYALEGGEALFDLMPGYRYAWVINYMLFGEFPLLPLICVSLFPIALFFLLRHWVGTNWSKALVLIWFCIPIFESFGFFHFYYIKLAARGFAEPMSYLAFIVGLAIVTPLLGRSFGSPKSKINTTAMECLVAGLMFSLAAIVRPNIIIGIVVVLTFLSLILIKKLNYKKLIFLCIGFSPVLLIPLHNIFYGGEFVPLTIAAYKDWNLGATPIDYFYGLKDIISLNLESKYLNKIYLHVGDEIKLHEIWYQLTLLICLYLAVSPYSEKSLRILAVSALSLQGLMLFYHVGGRYSYLTWTLSLLVILAWAREIVCPRILHHYITLRKHEN